MTEPGNPGDRFSAVPGAFRIGRVLGRGTALYFRYFIPFTLLSVILQAPYIILALAPPVVWHVPIPGVVSDIFGTIVWCFVCGAGVRLLDQIENGRSVRIADLSEALRRIPVSMFGLSLLFSIPSVIGAFTLDILSIVLDVGLKSLLIMALPALAFEGLSVRDAVTRGLELAQGRRWRVCGLVVMVYVILFVGIMLASVIFVAFQAMGGAPGLAVAENPIYTVLGVVVVSVWEAVVVSVLYFALRTEKEGPEMDRVATVFD